MLRSSIALDYTANGYKLGIEGIYTKTIRDLLFQQVNITDNPTYYGYNVAHPGTPYSIDYLNSRSQMQLGLRYSF